MPKPIRRKPTLRKIAERGFGFTGTTRGHRDIMHMQDIGTYVAKRHYFFIDKMVLRELAKSGGNKEINESAKKSFINSWGYAKYYANMKINIVNGKLQVGSEKSPWILYTFDLDVNIGTPTNADLPYNESMHSKKP